MNFCTNSFPVNIRQDNFSSSTINLKTTPIIPTTGRLYGMDYKTFRKWLLPHKEAIGKRIEYYYNFRQVGIIFQKLGTLKNYVFYWKKVKNVIMNCDEVLPNVGNPIPISVTCLH